MIHINAGTFRVDMSLYGNSVTGVGEVEGKGGGGRGAGGRGLQGREDKEQGACL